MAGPSETQIFKVFMSQVLLTCELNDLSTSLEGAPLCASGWQLVTPALPMIDLSAGELGLIMASTTAFLALCFVGSTMTRKILYPHTGEN